MRNYLILIGFIILLPCVVRSACHKYSLPSDCSVSFDDEEQIVQASSVYIVASEDEDGHDSSPFTITINERGGKLTREYVVDANFKRCEVGAYKKSDQPVVCGETILDGFKIEDRHFRISAKVIDGSFRILVENLDSTRRAQEQQEEVSRIISERFSSTSPNWPLSDGDYKYYCSRDVSAPFISGAGGVMRSRGALYLKGEQFLIRFIFRHNSTNGVAVAHAEGRVSGEIADGKIKNCVVTYDVGKDKVHARISLVQWNGQELPCGDLLMKHLGKAVSSEESAIRLSLAYGEETQNLDLMTDLHSSHGK